MKKLLYYITAGVLLSMGITSCKKQYDNYPAPSETLKGSIIDLTTKQPIQTEVGGVRIRLDEISWSANPTPFYFTSMQDGTYQNTKVFAATYVVTPDVGPFVPLKHGDTVNVKGITTVDFSVNPMLTIKWLSNPVVNGDKITANVQFSRGTNDPAYQNDVNDIFLFVCWEPYVGNNNYDPKYSYQLKYKAADSNAPIDGNTQLDTPVSLTSIGSLPSGRTYYVRVGVRTSYGQKLYNYTDVKTVQVP